MVKKIIVFGLLIGSFSLAQARVMMIENPNLERFESKTVLEVRNIVTPKVVAFETDQYLGSFVALQDANTNQFLPHRIISRTQKNSFSSSFEPSDLIDGTRFNLNDNNLRSYVTFDPKNTEHVITFSNPNKQWLEGIKIHLPKDTIAPQKITIEAKLDDRTWSPIINNQNFKSYLTFPVINPLEVRLKFQSPNLFRINEIDVMTPNNDDHKTKVIFYAREGQSIILWSNPAFGQKSIPVSRTTSAGLRTDETTPLFEITNQLPNPIFNPDFDQDGVIDTLDLCPRTADSQNADIDRNGRGDVCEDPDQDGIMSNVDNCPFVYNPNQSDQDSDQLGDVCDENESRISEQDNKWITVSFMVMIFALLFLITRSALQQKKESDNA